LCLPKCKIVVMVVSLFQPHNGYTNIEKWWQLEMPYKQVD